MRGRGIVFRLEETARKCFCVKGRAETKGNVLESSRTKDFTSSVLMWKIPKSDPLILWNAIRDRAMKTTLSTI